MRESLTGAKVLLQTTAEQDRKNIAPWIAAVTALSASSVLGYRLVFDAPEKIAPLAGMIGGNPAFALLFGVPRNLGTADGFNAWRALALGGFFTALLAIFTVVRNTRADEDSGQAELISSGVVGRRAKLASAIALACAASIGAGVVSFLGTMVFGGGAVDTAALCLTFTLTGFMFAGVAAIAAQVASYARTASGLAITVLGISYMMRGTADALTDLDWLRWVSPMGWTDAVHPASENKLWPLGIALVFFVLCVTVAFALQGYRDFGVGLVPPKPGPDRARAATNSVWGLAGRLNLGPTIAWLIAFAVLGTVMGYIASTVGSLVPGDLPFAPKPTSGAPIDMSFTIAHMLMQVLGMIAAVFGIGVAMRLYAEELEYRLEPLLATPLRRQKLLLSHGIVALLGPLLVMLTAAAMMGAAANANGGTFGIHDTLKQAAAGMPAVWVLVGVGLATVGARPQVRLVSWIGVVMTFALTILGPLFNLWDWILGISPMWHVPDVTGPNPDYGQLLALGAIVAALLGVAFVGFRRRDVL